MGTIKSAEIKPDIEPSLFPPTPKPTPTLPRDGKGAGSNQRRETSDFVPATHLIKEGPTKGHKDSPSQDDEYDDGNFAAAGAYRTPVLQLLSLTSSQSQGPRLLIH